MIPDLKLLGNQCLIRLAPRVPRESGIITDAEEMAVPPHKGRILQVGPKCFDVKPGDVVLIDPAAVAHDMGEPMFRTPHLIVSEAAIEAVLESA